MQPHLVGFGLAGLAVGLTAAILVCRKVSAARDDGATHLSRLEEISRLTGGLAHEIKNPLSTVKINLKLISEELEALRPADAGRAAANDGGTGLARALRKIAIVQKETDRLEQILDGFLRYVDRTELQLASVDINQIISDMVDFYSPQAYSHSVTIRQALHNEPLVCRVDADTLKQAVLNLFINAQQAMSRGGELIVRTDRRKNDAIIQISDTGTGIDPERLPHIFEGRFSSRPDGSGLGLPTAKKVIDSHNGTISVSSELGKGTSFTIRLPLQT